MATSTAFYQLTKPLTTELVDISVINANYDNIDYVMHENEIRSKQSAEKSMIGTDETENTTASRAYSQNEFFCKDGKFCVTLTSVSSGDTWTLNTNYSETTLSEVLTSILSQL